MSQIIIDLNMEASWLWGLEQHGPNSPGLETRQVDAILEQNKEKCIQLVLIIEKMIGEEIEKSQKENVTSQLIFFDGDRKKEFLNRVRDRSGEILRNIDADTRLSITLRLWSGCVFAMKTISAQTLSGPNEAMTRSNSFMLINTISGIDPIYRIGVESGPLYKAFLGQANDVSFAGVPEKSAVLKYKNDWENLRKRQAEIQANSLENMSKYVIEYLQKMNDKNK